MHPSVMLCVHMTCGLTHHTLALLNPLNVWCQKCDQLIIKMQEKWEDYKCMILLDHTCVKEFCCVPWMQDFSPSVPHDMHGKFMCMWLYFWSQWAAVAWFLDADFVERWWRYTWEWNYSFIIQDAGYQKLKPTQSTQDFQTTENFNYHRRGNPHWLFS